MRLLVDRTRHAQVKGADLANAHRSVGSQLAPFAARRCVLEDVSIDHVTGPSTGVAIAQGKTPIILALMRAGLFVAEGLWSALPGATLLLWNGDSETLEQSPIYEHPVIVVDSVLNSGRSINNALELLLPLEPSWISVATLVANEQGLAKCVDRWATIDFAVARISKRSYVGKGSTDTGARLFGTTDWE